MDVLRVPCFALVCPSNSSSVLSNPCRTQSLLSALRIGLLLSIHHLLCCCCRPPWQPVAQPWDFAPELKVVHQGRRKFPLSLTQHLWDMLTTVLAERLEYYQINFLPYLFHIDFTNMLSSNRNACPHLKNLNNHYLVDSCFALLCCDVCTPLGFSNELLCRQICSFSRAQKEILDHFSSVKPVQLSKRPPSWLLPSKQLLNLHYNTQLESILVFWTASIFLLWLPRNYRSSHHSPTVSQLRCPFLSQFSPKSQSTS